MSITARRGVTFAFASAVALVAVVIALDRFAGSQTAGAAEGAGAASSTSSTDGTSYIGPENVSSAQAAAVADGDVTYEEYEAAIHAAFECMVAKGWEVRMPPTPDATGLYLTYGFISDGSQRTEASMECLREHSMLVEMKWAAANTPTEADQLAARQATEACLVAGGFAPELIASAQRPDALIDHDAATFFRCANASASEFGIRGGGF